MNDLSTPEGQAERADHWESLLDNLMQHLADLGCNCDSLANKGGHVATCPIAIRAWLDSRSAEER